MDHSVLMFSDTVTPIPSGLADTPKRQQRPLFTREDASSPARDGVERDLRRLDQRSSVGGAMVLIARSAPDLNRPAIRPGVLVIAAVERADQCWSVANASSVQESYGTSLT